MYALEMLREKRTIRNLCVFCGSSNGVKQEYQAGADNLGRAMGERGINLIYGGGSLGLMGVLANSLKEYPVKITGIIPQRLHDLLKGMYSSEDELIVVSNMHERKATMYAKADAFVVLPGGIGTLEEFMEAFTWLQLGYHQKPIGLLNIAGYYSTLLNFLNESVTTGFLSQRMLETLTLATDANELLEKLLTVSVDVPLKIEV